jgi:ATP-dependent Lon protease
VLPVGGLREKVLAAHRAGLKTVLMPKRNLKDLVDVPKRARSELNIIPIEHMDQVLELALTPAPVEVRTQRSRRKKASAGQREAGQQDAEQHDAEQHAAVQQHDEAHEAAQPAE